MPLNGAEKDHLLGVIHQREPFQLPSLRQYPLELAIRHSVPDVHDILYI